MATATSMLLVMLLIALDTHVPMLASRVAILWLVIIVFTVVRVISLLLLLLFLLSENLSELRQ